MKAATKVLAPRMAVPDILEGMNGFRRLSVLVVGDLFLDEYIESEMYEVSKEGPLPAVRLKDKTQSAGAAGNLAASIRNLGAEVTVVGVIGNDANGKVLLSELRRKRIRTSGVIVQPSKPTLTYTKIRAHVENAPSREILRMDVLPDAPLNAGLERRVLAAVRKEAAQANAVIVLDQIDHLVTSRLLRELPDLARRAGAVLHGSSRERIGLFRRFHLITPNDRETRGAVGGDGDFARMGRELKRRGEHEQMLLTLGAAGMLLFPRRSAPLHLPSHAEDVQDVTGAGDALSSAAVLGNALGWDLRTVAWTASQAAAIAIAYQGTHHVTLDELRRRLQRADGRPAFSDQRY